MFKEEQTEHGNCREYFFGAHKNGYCKGASMFDLTSYLPVCPLFLQEDGIAANV